ncbi:HTH-type transcriptional regulator YesS [Paenibacillus sp. J31TS4]|uniref:AraC family transcriptional regulator n=1 Tax=Paenibacillus sp. J31TS4 TaxID=2807195 RepID=UPI001B05B6EC|nr:AraC family transcriptional regulator [Paenibacillus sp. J31TS4]GIP40862.1 HTH-type transcriptional regulator YesS [Paenibacillus sp. J31TS4]
MLQPLSFVRRLPYHHKLKLYLLVLSIFPVLLLGLLSASLAGKSVQEESERNQKVILKQVEHQLDTLLKNLAFTSLQMAADRTIEKSLRLGIAQNDPVRLETTLDMKEVVRQYRSYSGTPIHVSLVYNRFGQVYGSHLGLLPLQEFPFYDLIKHAVPKYDGAIVIPPYSRAGQEDFLMLRPVPVGSPDIDGWVVLHIDPQQIYEAFRAADPGVNRRLMILDEEGRIMLSNRLEDIGSRLPTASGLYAYWTKPTKANAVYRLDGTDYHLSSETSSFNGWTYIAMTPVRDITHKADVIRFVSWGIAAALASVWALLALLGTKRLYLPIRRLAFKIPGGPEPGGDGLQALDGYVDRVVQANTQLRRQLGDQLPSLQETLLVQLMRGELGEKELRDRAAAYGLAVPEGRFYLGVVAIDDYPAFRRRYSARDRALLQYALAKLAGEVCAGLPACLPAAPEPGQLVLLLRSELPEPEAGEQLDRLLAALREQAGILLRLQVTAARSDAAWPLGAIGRGLQGTLSRLRYRVPEGSRLAEAPGSDASAAAMRAFHAVYLARKQEVLAAIAEGRLSDAEEAFRALLGEAPGYLAGEEGLMSLLGCLLGEIERFYAEGGQSLPDIAGNRLYEAVASAASLEALGSAFEQELFPALRSHLEQADDTRRRQLVARAVACIHEQFAADLSLTLIAERCGCSPTQLSRMFKEEVGTTFVDYVIGYRIEKAKEWLVHSDMPIREITDRLRYATTQNFTRIFKQMTGLPPGQYRERYRGSV